MASSPCYDPHKVSHDGSKGLSAKLMMWILLSCCFIYFCFIVWPEQDWVYNHLSDISIVSVVDIKPVWRAKQIKPKTERLCDTGNLHSIELAWFILQEKWFTHIFLERSNDDVQGNSRFLLLNAINYFHVWLYVTFFCPFDLNHLF